MSMEREARFICVNKEQKLNYLRSCQKFLFCTLKPVSTYAFACVSNTTYANKIRLDVLILQIFKQHNIIILPEAVCVDTDNGATDVNGYVCTFYTRNPSACGGYDDNDFVSILLCCACGGGTASNIPDILY